MCTDARVRKQRRRSLHKELCYATALLISAALIGRNIINLVTSKATNMFYHPVDCQSLVLEAEINFGAIAKPENAKSIVEGDEYYRLSNCC